MKKLYFLVFLFILLFSKSLGQGTGCPEITASPDQTLPCSQTCTDISAEVFEVGETNTYTVGSIPHIPPIAYNAAGGTAVSVNTDDVWSGVINLPFPFCFFGQTYTSAIIGSNGSIGFNTSSAGGYHPWPFSASVPSTALTSAGNIFGPYHDIDPSVAGSVRWYLTGQAPCRTFIVVYQNLGFYSCTSLRTNHMMVLYETTNIIEVYVQGKPTCNSWNSGNTVIGIQNAAGTVGYTPPGRNTGSWTVNSPEAWQFVPDGPPIYSPVQWYEGTTLVGTGSTINICPPAGSTIYTARTTYTRCDGLTIDVEDDVTINYEEVSVSVNPSNVFSCSGTTVTLSATAPSANSFVWNPGSLTGQSINVFPTSTTTYTVTATNTSNGCSAQANATVNIAQPVNTGCNVLYVTPTGISSNDGTKASPLDLETALELGACNGTVIKMAVGDYITDTTINKVTSYITLEGGFDPSINWDKISTAGATRILRTATRSTSTTTTSLILGSGIPNEFGPNPEVVAIEINNQTGFRFQDLTIRSELTNPNDGFEGENGVDVVGVRLNSCSTYEIVRTQINTSQAGKGGNQSWSIPAEDGGDARGLVALSNGSSSNLRQCNITAGAAGAGGNSNVNGTPSPLGGNAGTSQAIQLTGMAFGTNQNTFNLVGQNTIQMDDIACTATDIDYNSATSNSWNFGSGSSPVTGTGSTVTTLYNTLGRKTINFAGSSYVGFANIILDDQILPEFEIDADTMANGWYRICQGDEIIISALNGNTGYTYYWEIIDSFRIDTTNVNTTIGQLGPVPIDSTGIFIIELRYETSCCGLSSPTIEYLVVEEQPMPIMPSNDSICLGQNNAIELNVGGITTNGSISWFPNNGIAPINGNPAYALPNTTTTYYATLTDSSGLCSALDSVTINIIDLILTPSSTDVICNQDGTAGVSVSGGSGNYSYMWSSGQATSSITNLYAGIYRVVVTDNVLGCQDSIDILVSPSATAVDATLTKQDILCNGANDGSISLSITGGNVPYNITWSAPLTPGGTIKTNLSPGTYSVLVTDNLGCTDFDSVTITEPNALNMNLDSLLMPTCHENTDGYVEVRVDGGIRPHTYSWSNGMVVTVINDEVIGTNMPADSLYLYVEDDNGCLDTLLINLHVDSLFGTLDTTVCYNSNLLLPNGSNITLLSDTSINVVITNSTGCDSTITVNVTIDSFIVENIDTTICQGQTITVNGETYTSNGFYQDTTRYVVSGCDSIQYNITLHIDSFVIVNIDTTICQGQTLYVNGVNYNANGYYQDTAHYTVSGCDSIQYNITLHIDSFVVVNIDTTICQGQTLSVNGETYSANGFYQDTARYTASGCDSIQYNITLNIDSFTVENIDTTICQGQTLSVNGVNYNVNGYYQDTASYTVSGCDSILFNINLHIDSFVVLNIDTTICQGQTLSVNGETYSANGFYQDTARYSVSGCDSIQYNINLHVDNFVVVNIDTTICQGQTLSVNGETYSANGFYQDTTRYVVSGCDSIQYNITLHIDSFVIVNIDTTICQGQTLSVNGETYSANGFYQDTARYSVSGCDSIQYNINLHVDNFVVVNIDTTICQGQTLSVNGETYTNNGFYQDTARYSVSGCDSIQYNINLHVDNFVVVNIDTTICQGQTLSVNGETYSANGFYQDTARYTASGCDSIQYNITLNIDSVTPVNVDTTICGGDTLWVNGIGYSSSGNYIDTAYYSASGCDSIHFNIDLNVVYLTVVNIDTTLCPGETITVNGIDYSSSGNYFDSILYSNSICDSIQFNISLNYDTVTPVNIDTTICQGETINVNGIQYATSGNFLDTAYYTSSGCDSIHYNITLQIDSPIQINLNDTICQGDSVTLNEISYYNTGTYYDTLFYSNSGCDSVHYTLNLIRLDFTTETINETICNGGTYSFNGENYTIEGTYYDSTQYSFYACDSVHYIININVDSVETEIITQSICEGDTFIFNGVIYTSQNTYFDTLYHAVSGCDSIWYEIQLTVNPLPNVIASATPNDSICENNSLTLNASGAISYSWSNIAIQTGVPFMPNVGFTQYVLTGTDANNCSKTDTINIVGLETAETTVNITICEDEIHTLPDGSQVNTEGPYTTTIPRLSNGCDSVITTNLTVNKIGSFDDLENIVVCSGLSVSLDVNPQNMTNFEWFVNEGGGNISLIGNPNYVGANTGVLSFNLDTSLHQNIYTVQMLDECGNSYSTNMTIEVFNPHAVENGIADTTFCSHEITVVTVNYNGYNYQWSTGEFGPSISPEYSGDYIVTFNENYTNCLLSDTINITIEDCIGTCVVLAPTGFSPNGSGTNDIFRVVTSCDEGFDEFSFSVYNRWGELVYYTNNWREGWDGIYKGRNAEIGTYTYYVEYTKSISQEKGSIKGNVTLIR